MTPYGLVRFGRTYRLRRLVAAFLPRRPEFDPRSGQVRVALGVGFLLVLRFLLPILIPSAAPHSLSVIRGWYNRPNSGRRTKWTRSHPHVTKLKIKTFYHHFRVEETSCIPIALLNEIPTPGRYFLVWRSESPHPVTCQKYHASVACNSLGALITFRSPFSNCTSDGNYK
jgi:hypothetical protein